MHCQNSLAILLAMAATSLTGAAIAGEELSWNYQSYNSKGASAPGYITLYENNGEHTFRFFAGRLDSCYSREMKAVVEKTEDMLTITLPPVMQGCGEIRFKLLANGSGGTREVKKGDEWVADKADRVLTRRD